MEIIELFGIFFAAEADADSRCGVLFDATRLLTGTVHKICSVLPAFSRTEATVPLKTEPLSLDLLWNIDTSHCPHYHKIPVKCLRQEFAFRSLGIFIANAPKQNAMFSI